MFVKVAGMEGGGEVMSERHKRRMRRVERERERERVVFLASLAVLKEELGQCSHPETCSPSFLCLSFVLPPFLFFLFFWSDHKETRRNSPVKTSW